MLRVHRQFIVLRYTVSHTASGKRRRAETLYRVARKSADLLRTLSVIAALAASVVVLGATISPAQATFPGKNGKIAFTHIFQKILDEGALVTSDIYTVNPDGTNLTNLTADTSTSVSEGEPAWSPDGTKIAFSSDLNNKSPGYLDDIYVMDADGSNPKRLTNNDYREQFVGSWSPDGAKMVLSCYRTVWGHNEICRADADGSNNIRLTTSENSEAPAWSPDGTKIAFTGSGGIHTMNPDGSNQTRVTAGGDQGDWSPDGTKIAYTRYPSGQSHSDIYIANADGSNPLNLTARISNTSNEAVPAWSPDGTQIAFASNLHEYDETTYEIFVIDADGRNLKQLTNSPGTNWDPDWQPLPGPTEATPEKQQEQRQQNQQQPSQHGSKSRSVTVHPPDTGGPSLLLVGGALLFAVGVLLYAVVKRRM
jgi:Tol biopolymer transport system component